MKRTYDDTDHGTANGEGALGRHKVQKSESPGATLAPPEGNFSISGIILRKEQDEGQGIRCLHEVSVPEGQELPPRKPPPAEPAKRYPFTLDPFQEEAIRCLENGESVLVSAHTSAGKTVVAEYAIAMALRDKQRVIYTSPIKALSNQKFRELAEEFSDVGLMTGDVTIASSASCLVMTTEILRSMIYRGSSVIREVGWIIFDEVHYMRDRERGVVWEESIVMAPRGARFVFLSATVPNAREFSDWVAKVHHQPCHIVYTDFRPTPLEHFIFPAGGKGIHLVVDKGGNFREGNFQKAINEMGAMGVEEKGRKKGKDGKWSKDGPTDGPSDIFRIVKMIMQRQYDPCIVFSFSKADCEALARQMSKLDLNDEDEKKLVEGVFQNAIDSLSPEDKKLPQVASMLPLLLRGIGIHHSGLLPILKEVIEILFQEGLLKCLFATETFSIGLNMPAKTVVFTHVRKWDGDRNRWLSGGEYIQMSGRAGRRGLDDRGICILMVDSKMEPAVAKAMVRGTADALNSSFHLSYNMVLNQMRSEDSTVEQLLQHSFAQFQATRSLPTLQRKIKDLEEEIKAVAIENEAGVEEILNQRRQLRKLRNEIRTLVNAPLQALPFLSPGRIVRILCRPFSESDEGAAAVGEGERLGEMEGGDRQMEEPTTWGLVVNFQKVAAPKQVAADNDEEEEGDPRPTETKYEVDVLARCREEVGAVGPGAAGRGRRKLAHPCLPGEEGGEPLVAGLPLAQVDRLSAVRVHMPKELLSREARDLAVKTLKETMARFPDGIPLLDPEEDMQVKSGAYRKAVRRAETLEGLLSANPLSSSPTLGPRLGALRRKQALGAALKAAKREVKATEGLILKDELKARRRVLRRLGYANSDDVVQLKGRVACEIATADEVVMTELIFEGTFRELSPEQAAALVSCFVWQEKTAEGSPKLRDNLAEPLRQLRDVARRVAKVEGECKLPTDVDEYANSFRPDIMEATFAWCQGAKFGDILKLTDKVFEGSLIRALRRLEEVLRQLVQACKSIGESDLEAKFQEAIKLMKRDIVFAASLYL